MEKIHVNSSGSSGQEIGALWNFSISCLESIKLFFSWKEVLSLILTDKFWKILLLFVQIFGIFKTPLK